MSTTQLLEENIGAQVHDIPAPAPHWIEMKTIHGSLFLDLNSADDKYMFLNQTVRYAPSGFRVAAAALPKHPFQCRKCFKVQLPDNSWTGSPTYVNTNTSKGTVCPACASKEVVE